MSAKGCKGRGGWPNAKKYEGARHRGPKGRARRCDSTERTHERAERRFARAEIEAQLQEVSDA